MVSLPSPQKLLFLFFVAAVSVVLGLRIGKLFKREATLPQLPSEVASEIGESSELETAEPGPVSGGEETLPKGWESYTGIIREAVGTSGGTHQLISKDGEVLILLEARDQKLVVSEGMEAEVQGPVKAVEDSDLRLMTVERVVFR